MNIEDGMIVIEARYDPKVDVLYYDINEGRHPTDIAPNSLRGSWVKVQLNNGYTVKLTIERTEAQP